MTKSQLFSDVFDENQSSGVALKNKELKKIIFNFLDKVDTSSITELSKELNISVPKTTSLINELIKNELIKDEGKVESTGGRKANMYGLVPDACFFLGVDIKKYYINIGLLNFTISPFERELIKFYRSLKLKMPNRIKKNLLRMKKFIGDKNAA